MIQIGRSIYISNGTPTLRLVDNAGINPGDTVRVTQWLGGKAEIHVIQGKRKLKVPFMNADNSVSIDRDVSAGAKKCPTIRLIKDYGIGSGSAMLVQHEDGTATLKQ